MESWVECRVLQQEFHVIFSIHKSIKPKPLYLHNCPESTGYPNPDVMLLQRFDCNTYKSLSVQSKTRNIRNHDILLISRHPVHSA